MFKIQDQSQESEETSGQEVVLCAKSGTWSTMIILRHTQSENIIVAVGGVFSSLAFKLIVSLLQSVGNTTQYELNIIYSYLFASSAIQVFV